MGNEATGESRVRTESTRRPGVRAEYPGRAVRGGSTGRSWVRTGVWLLHVTIPVLALWLLIAQPSLDVRWEHHGAHFALVLATAAVNVILGLLVGQAASRRQDARLFLVSLAFVMSAGFLGLHALATPGVLLSAKNIGFDVATPIGLFLAAIFAAASALEFKELGAQRVLRLRTPLWLVVAAILIAWGVWSVGGLPPLNRPTPSPEADATILATVAGGTVLYALAAVRYFLRYRRRPAVVLIGVITAFVLLAEASISVLYGRNWQASWWEWHVLMTAAYGFVAYSAYVHYAREGSPVGLFDGVALDRTIEQIRQDHSAALDEMATAMRRHAAGEEGEPISQVAARLAARFDLTERQLDVLERSADALGFERTQRQRLGGLVRVGREARVIRDEQELIARAMTIAADTFAPDKLSLTLVGDRTVSDPLREEALRSLDPVEGADGRRYVVPLDVKGHAAGVLEATRAQGAFGEADRSLLRSLASQLSIVLENARLYHQLEGLFRSYMSPDVATALLADPSQAKLGGSVVEVTVLMADLRGFTPFSEHARPDTVVAMLNAYFGAVVPVILDEGGTVTQFVGDAVMAVFNAPVRQPDHALRAARAGLRLQQVAEQVAAGRDDWPRFRVGINSGPALVGNIGSAEMRNFTAIGDTTNLAARLEALAEPGQVVVGESVLSAFTALGAAAECESLGAVTVKGKRQPVRAYVLRGLVGVRL
jgi:class 3 adenylate cyclase